jgi:hypothetical protein
LLFSPFGYCSLLLPPPPPPPPLTYLYFFLDRGNMELTWCNSLIRPHTLRYVLKNRETNQELFVVVIELLPTEQAKKEGAEGPNEKFEEVHGGDKKEGESDDLD